MPRSNVVVCVRVRDCVVGECPDDVCVRMNGKACEVNIPGRGRFPFAFDQCFWSHRSCSNNSHVSQESLFKSVGFPMVNAAFQGFNTCLMSFGATGSGKTFSVFGPPGSVGTSDMGLIPRLCDEVFFRLRVQENATVRMSVVEVYMEGVFDLLCGRKELKVRPDGSSFSIVGARQPTVRNYDDVTKLLQDAENSKTVCQTAVHERSSRAHTIFQMEIEVGKQLSKIALVDLAGCERVKEAKTDSGVALEEACSINLSLMTLGKCIEAAARRSKCDFRSSTLTKLLKEFLCGNSVTTILINISPTLKDSGNTVQALRFADRAKNLQTTPSSNTYAGPSKATFESQSELQKRRELLVLEFEAENALRKSQESVLNIEELCTSCSSDDELRVLIDELQQAVANRDSCEVELETVRKEVYPREYALRDELERLRHEFEWFRDERETDLATANMRIHELTHQLQSTENQRDALNAALGDLRRSFHEKDATIFGLKNELATITCRFECEKEQLQQHFESNNLASVARSRETEELLRLQLGKANDENRLHASKFASMRSALEMERLRLMGSTQRLIEFSTTFLNFNHLRMELCFDLMFQKQNFFDESLSTHEKLNRRRHNDCREAVLKLHELSSTLSHTARILESSLESRSVFADCPVNIQLSLH